MEAEARKTGLLGGFMGHMLTVMAPHSRASAWGRLTITIVCLVMAEARVLVVKEMPLISAQHMLQRNMCRHHRSGTIRIRVPPTVGCFAIGVPAIFNSRTLLMMILNVTSMFTMRVHKWQALALRPPWLQKLACHVVLVVWPHLLVRVLLQLMVLCEQSKVGRMGMVIFP